MGSFLNEDFVERRFEQLESRDLRTGLQSRFQNLLRIGARLQFRFRAGAEAVHARDSRVIQETIGAAELDLYRILAVGLFDRAQLAIKHVLALVDQADRIAHALDLLHTVSGENDR